MVCVCACGKNSEKSAQNMTHSSIRPHQGYCRGQVVGWSECGFTGSSYQRIRTTLVVNTFDLKRPALLYFLSLGDLRRGGLTFCLS